MERKARPFNDREVDFQTTMSQRRVKSTVELAKKLAEDPDRQRRLDRQVCTACHYFTRMAGQSFTKQPCACCGESQTYSSTDTDALCLPCAKERGLCKHCMGRI